jgi:pyrroloquinoline quinone biosynthesis protein E
MTSECWQLATGVVLRPEAFGGMAFHRLNGMTMEVDQEAYDFLRCYVMPCPLPLPPHPAAHLVPQLVRLGFLQEAESDYSGSESILGHTWLGDGSALSAPETVHLALTRRCNQSCPGCYAFHAGADEAGEWSVADLCHLIDQWAEMRVFQMAVGGGEPLLYEGLFEVLEYARQKGIVCNLTTNGTLLDEELVRHLERVGVARVNVSWDGMGDDSQSRQQGTRRALRLLSASKLQIGVNLLVTPTRISQLLLMLAEIQELDAHHVTILRPKPPTDRNQRGMDWYHKHQLVDGDLPQLGEILGTWRGRLRLEVDCSLSGLMDHLPPAFLRWHAIYGCCAGRRICTLWPDGRVTPCSFLALCAGNIRRESFAQLWTQPEEWDTLRDNPPSRKFPCLC